MASCAYESRLLLFQVVMATVVTIVSVGVLGISLGALGDRIEGVKGIELGASGG